MADEAQDRKTPDTERAEGEEPQGTEVREFSEDELKEILDAHKRWLESEGKESKQANLQGANLQEASLQRANLQKAMPAQPVNATPALSALAGMSGRREGLVPYPSSKAPTAAA